MVTLTSETSSSETHFETKTQAIFDKPDQSFEQQQQASMEFQEKQHQESKNMYKEMVALNSETLCLSEADEVQHETPDTFSSQFIVQEDHISKLSAYFEE